MWGGLVGLGGLASQAAVPVFVDAGWRHTFVDEPAAVAGQLGGAFGRWELGASGALTVGDAEPSADIRTAIQVTADWGSELEDIRLDSIADRWTTGLRASWGPRRDTSRTLSGGLRLLGGVDVRAEERTHWGTTDGQKVEATGLRRAVGLGPVLGLVFAVDVGENLRLRGTVQDRLLLYRDGSEFDIDRRNDPGLELTVGWQR